MKTPQSYDLALDDRAFLVRAAARMLSGALDDVLDVLAYEAYDGGGWLRPLAVICVDIEYSVKNRAQVDLDDIEEACRRASELLRGALSAKHDFTWRYARARRSSPLVAAFHQRALGACEHLKRRLSLQHASQGNLHHESAAE